MAQSRRPKEHPGDRHVHAANRAANIFAGESVRAMQNGWTTFSLLIEQAIPSNEDPVDPREIQKAYMLGWNNYFEGMAQATQRAARELILDEE